MARVFSNQAKYAAPLTLVSNGRGPLNLAADRLATWQQSAELIDLDYAAGDQIWADALQPRPGTTLALYTPVPGEPTPQPLLDAAGDQVWIALTLGGNRQGRQKHWFYTAENAVDAWCLARRFEHNQFLSRQIPAATRRGWAVPDRDAIDSVLVAGDWAQLLTLFDIPMASAQTQSTSQVLTLTLQRDGQWGHVLHSSLGYLFPPINQRLARAYAPTHPPQIHDRLIALGHLICQLPQLADFEISLNSQGACVDVFGRCHDTATPNHLAIAPILRT